MRQYNLEWLAQEGFEYQYTWNGLMGPDELVYRHPDGRNAHLEDTKEGRLSIDGICGIDALDVFGAILSRSNYHL